MSRTQAGRTQQMPKLDSKLIAPRGARAVGIFRDAEDGGQDKIIYEMVVQDIPAMKASKRQVMTAEGRALYRNEHRPENAYPVYEIPELIWREKRFILRAPGNGNVKMVEHFETTPEERAEAERRRQTKGFVEDFAHEAVRRGYPSARAMLDELFGALGAQPTDEQQQMADDADDLAKVRDLNAEHDARLEEELRRLRGE